MIEHARQDPELLRRLLRAKDRMDVASHEEWPVSRLARVSRVSHAHWVQRTGSARLLASASSACALSHAVAPSALAPILSCAYEAA